MELPKHLQEKLQKMLEVDKNSSGYIELTDEYMINDCKACERFYKRTTIEHIKQFIDRGYEGNVDERNWYRYAIVLKNKGYDLETL